MLTTVTKYIVRNMKYGLPLCPAQLVKRFKVRARQLVPALYGFNHANYYVRTFQKWKRITVVVVFSLYVRIIYCITFENIHENV